MLQFGRMKALQKLSASEAFWRLRDDNPVTVLIRNLAYSAKISPANFTNVYA